MLHLLLYPPHPHLAKMLAERPWGRRLTTMFHKSIKFPLIRDTWVGRTLKGGVITSEQGLQVWAARWEKAVSNYSPGGCWWGLALALALFRATGWLSCVSLALRKVTRRGRCPQVETPAYHSWLGGLAGVHRWVQLLQGWWHCRTLSSWVSKVLTFILLAEEFRSLADRMEQSIVLILVLN